MRYALFAFLSLSLVSLACLVNLGGPATPTAPIPVSTEAVESLQELWNGALESAQESGSVTLVLNETQVTSLVAFKLAQQSDPFFQDPQVFLRDGQIQVFGKVRRGSLEASVSFVLAADIDENGVPQFQLLSADFGPLPVPDGLLEGLSTMLDEAFTGSIGPAATGIRVESIAIDGGLLAITGRIR